MALKTVSKSPSKESPKTEGPSLEDRVSLAHMMLAKDIQRLREVSNLTEILEIIDDRCATAGNAIATFIDAITDDIEKLNQYLAGEYVYDGKEGDAE